MADRNTLTSEQLRTNVIERMWLHHFNNELLAQGMITESQHQKMRIKINNRKPSADRK